MIAINFVSIDGAKNCVSREEFDTLQRELHYWQNTTINILKKYLIDNQGNLLLNLMLLESCKH